MTTRALVLGGGGVTGVAWELGMLHGLAEAGVDLSDADLVVGTSAGSVVAAQVTAGTELAELYERQLRSTGSEVTARMRFGTMLRLAAASLGTRDAQEAGVRIGRLALAARTVPAAERRAIIASRLPVDAWPDRRLLITAVAADTGEFVAFDRDSGVSLVDAVAASCAVPGVWPPAVIDGRPYIDGGMRSPANVDLADGADRVVVLAPIAAAFRRSRASPPRWPPSGRDGRRPWSCPTPPPGPRSAATCSIPPGGRPRPGPAAPRPRPSSTGSAAVWARLSARSGRLDRAGGVVARQVPGGRVRVVWRLLEAGDDEPGRELPAELVGHRVAVLDRVIHAELAGPVGLGQRQRVERDAVATTSSCRSSASMSKMNTSGLMNPDSSRPPGRSTRKHSRHTGPARDRTHWTPGGRRGRSSRRRTRSGRACRRAPCAGAARPGRRPPRRARAAGRVVEHRDGGAGRGQHRTLLAAAGGQAQHVQPGQVGRKPVAGRRRVADQDDRPVAGPGPLDDLGPDRPGPFVACSTWRSHAARLCATGSIAPVMRASLCSDSSAGQRGETGRGAGRAD